MIDLSKREKYIFILSVTVVVFALSYNFMFSPWLDRYNDISRRISLEKARLSKGVRMLENSDEILKRYSLYASSYENISWILNYIDKQAAVSGIKTISVKPGSLIGREREINLQIEGETCKLRDFIAALVNSPVKAGLKRFDFRSTPKNPDYLTGTIILSKPIL